MPDVALNTINDGHNGTSIEAQGERYANDYVFSADASNADIVHRIDGLRGVGVNEGDGVVGRGGEGGAGVSGRGGQALQRGRVHVAGTGVIGRGGSLNPESGERPGAGVIGMSTDARDPSPEERAGAGVVGAGATPARHRAQVGGTGVVGIGGVPMEEGRVGAGVVGISSAIQFPPSALTAGVGVLWVVGRRAWRGRYGGRTRSGGGEGLAGCRGEKWQRAWRRIQLCGNRSGASGSIERNHAADHRPSWRSISGCTFAEGARQSCAKRESRFISVFRTGRPSNGSWSCWPRGGSKAAPSYREDRDPCEYSSASVFPTRCCRTA